MAEWNTSKEQHELTKDRVEHYFDVTNRAMKKVKQEAGKKEIDFSVHAKDFFGMATNYFNDAKFFYSKGDLINAFAALNYAHGWLDAGARMGLFDVDGDDVLFTVDGKD